jgi:hypothetical protein
MTTEDLIAQERKEREAQRAARPSYFTTGSVSIDNLTPEQALFFERLVTVVDLAHDSGQVPPWEWGGAGPLRAKLAALAYFASSDYTLTVDDLSWHHCISVDNGIGYYVKFSVDQYPALSLGARQEALFRILTDAMDTVYADMYPDLDWAFTYMNTLEAGSQELANEIASFFHNLRDLAFYSDIRIASNGDTALQKLAWQLAMNEDDYSETIIEVGADRTVVYIGNEDTFDAEFMEKFLQGAMQILGMDRTVGFEWTHGSSRGGNEGGGACVVSAGDSVWLDTGYFASVLGHTMLRGVSCPRCKNLCSQDKFPLMTTNDKGQMYLDFECECGERFEAEYRFVGLLSKRDSE